MEAVWSHLRNYATSEQATSILVAVILVLAGFLLARLASMSVGRFLARRTDAHHNIVIRRVTYYSIAGLFVSSALVEVGFNIGVFLGAAGILTVAIGFASQTSASNIISGLFLLGEKPFPSAT